MPPFDGKAMAADVLAAVRDYVARAVAPLQTNFVSVQAEVRRAFEETAAINLMMQEVLKIPIPKDGEPGPPGPPGEPGPPGANVSAEEVRPMIVEEISNTIALLPKPKDGTPGRDAAHLEIAAEIDEGKSYPRGTYARHANGFWRSYETTAGMRGWECLVAGIAGIEVLCNHEREFQVIHTLSDGKQFSQKFEIPVSIYRGVFVEGREYHRGDQVSWGAHQWHCNEPTTDKPIEGGKAWTLAVKRGRDGKEGPPGPAGKDRVVRETKA